MSTGRRHAAALLDAQEQAMEQTETAIAEFHRLLGAQNGVVRSWRMRLMQWRHRVTIVEQGRLNEDTARQLQMTIDDINDRIEDINDRLTAPDDELAGDLAELSVWLKGKDLPGDLDALKQALPIAIQQVKSYANALADYQEEMQAFQKNQRDLTRYEDQRLAHERQARAYARYQDERQVFQENQQKRKAHEQATGGMSADELAKLLNTNGPTATAENGLLSTNQSGLNQIVAAAIAQYAPTGAMPVLPVFSLYGMDKDDLAPVDAELNYGDWDGGTRELTAVFKKHVDRVLGEFNTHLQALQKLPRIELPTPVVPPEPLPQPPAAIARPVSPQAPLIQLEPLEYDAHWLPANAVDAELVEQLETYASGPYTNTNEHLDEINDLAQQLGHGCPTIADHRHDWDDAWDQSGMSDALDAVFDSHAAFGSQRHSTHGSRIIERLMSATEALYDANDRRHLRNAERRFQTAKLDMLAWWQTRWTERGGTPENDNTYKKWQPTGGIAPLK